MNNEYSEAFSETLEVLKYMEDELLNKIPLELIRKMKLQRSESYINKFEDKNEVDFNQLSEKTKNILAVLYRDYIADEAEKIEFDKMINQNELKGNGQDYTIKKFEKERVHTNDFLPAIVPKKSFIKKLFETWFKTIPKE